jgi:aerobic carbon-monoxide dehydrogenase large subunit
MATAKAVPLPVPAPTPTKFLGKPLKRKEDPRLIQGMARYVDDLVLPGMLHVVFVRSPYAHARIRSMDSARAKAVPGVLAVLTAADIQSAISPVPCAAQIPDMKPAPRPVLAVDRVRFVGEAVAAIVAESRSAARDAADLVDVDYEALTPVVDPEKSIARGSPTLFDGHADNLAYRWQLEGGDVAPKREPLPNRPMARPMAPMTLYQSGRRAIRTAAA